MRAALSSGARGALSHSTSLAYAPRMEHKPDDSALMLRYRDGVPFVTNPYHINEQPKAALLAMFRELRQTAKDAPDGEVLHQAELFAVSEGQKLIRQGLESVIQDQAQEVSGEKKRDIEPDLLAVQVIDLQCHPSEIRIQKSEFSNPPGRVRVVLNVEC